jgi:hypothetical protein
MDGAEITARPDRVRSRCVYGIDIKQLGPMRLLLFGTVL